MEPLTCERIRGSERSGEYFADRAYAMLEEHTHFRGRAGHFELVYQEDVLIVRGAVPSFYLKQMLQTVLRDVDGVRLIDNQVQVISATGVSGGVNR